MDFKRHSDFPSFWVDEPGSDAHHDVLDQPRQQPQVSGRSPISHVGHTEIPQGIRKMTLEHGPANAKIIMRGANGSVMAALDAAQMKDPTPSVPIRGNQDIASIQVIVPGVETGTCNIAAAQPWINTTSHLQVDIQVHDGQVLCGLANRAIAGVYPDRSAVSDSTRCMYVPGENGAPGGLQCRLDVTGSNQEYLSRRS
ncbi:MAG: hypothetical protein K0U52_11190 [Gammaproteobacteria bacterium]|nr:hypothetical protein [Gammaproteobacteria bacterium]